MNYERFQHSLDGKTKSIFLVNMTKEPDHHFSEAVLSCLEKYISTGKRIGIIVNKKGYAGGIICHSCGNIPQCTRCSVSISYYKNTGGDMMGLCHICKTQYEMPRVCPACHKADIKPYGLGTQKVQEYIKQTYGVDSLRVESETVNSPTKISKLLAEVDKYQVIVGTSLLSTPIPNYPLDVVIFLHADTGLNMPDYGASAQNFELLYGTFCKHNAPFFIVQTFNPEWPSIRYACKLDRPGFEAIDHAFRKEHDYPPFGELCVLMYKNEIEERLYTQVDKLYKELLYLKEKYELKDLIIYSTPPLIYKVFGKYRYNIIIKGPQVRQFIEIIYSKCKLQSRGFKVDRNAQSVV